MQVDNERLLINLIEKRKIFWEPIVAAGLLLVAILGTMVPLYIHSDNANRALIEAISKDVKAIQQEMKDFHGKLERQDAEYKAHLMHLHATNMP
jgi:hypothetical protein